jgi:hypothetical protein
MKSGRILAAAGAALILLGGGVAYAATAATAPTASCVVTNPAPSMTTGANGSLSFTSGVKCTAAIPRSRSTSTVTKTVTASPSSTSAAATKPSATTAPASATSTATPAVARTTASTPSASSSPAAGGTGWVRPTAASTGYHGALSPWAGSTTFTANNQTISNTDFGGYIKVTGANLVLDNCHFAGMVFFGPGPLTVKNCTSNGGINSDATYRPINGVTYDHVHVIAGAHDGIDVFSSSANHESNVTLVDTLIDGMSFPAGSTSHGDGLQVRGVNGLTVTRVVVNDGPYQSQDNSAIYFENVNGGDSTMRLTDVDLYGGGYTFYTNAVSASSATNLAVKAAGHWGSYHSNAKPSGWSFTNVTGPNGAQMTP